MAYILVLNFASPIDLLSSTEYLPNLVIDQFKKNDIPLTRPGSDRSVTSLAAQIALAKTKDDFLRLANTQKTLELGQIDKRFDFVEYSAFLKCMNAKSDPPEVAGLVSDTSLLVGNVAREQNPIRVNKISQAAIDSAANGYMSEILSASTSCPYEIVVVQRRMPVNDLVALAGPANTYFAAAERTLYDAYVVIGFKLSPYVEFNPYKSMPEFVQSLVSMVRSTFLGITVPDESRSRLVELFSRQVEAVKGGVNVPFSPMAASSLTSSAFFICYLIVIGLATLRSRVVTLFARIVPNVDLEKAVFTTVALTMSGSFLIILVISGTTSVLWEWAFR